MAGGRKDRGLYDERNVLRTSMWLEVVETEDCMMDAMNPGARMWLEVGETGDCMMDAMCQDPGCGWR